MRSTKYCRKILRFVHQIACCGLGREVLLNLVDDVKILLVALCEINLGGGNILLNLVGGGKCDHSFPYCYRQLLDSE